MVTRPFSPEERRWLTGEKVVIVVGTVVEYGSRFQLQQARCVAAHCSMQLTGIAEQDVLG